MTIDIRNSPCDCPKGQCACHCSNDDHCINRLTGDVRTIACSTCGSSTWHQDGKCLRCQSLVESFR